MAKAKTATSVAKPRRKAVDAPASAAAGGAGKAKTAGKPAKKKPVQAPTVVDPTEARRKVARDVAVRVAAAGLEKKAERIEIIDIGEKVDYADYLVLMSGRSDRQVQSIAKGIDEALRLQGVKVQGTEGMAEGHWVLLDFSDVIVHVFLEEVRRSYDLEGMWMEANRVPFDMGGRPSLPPEPVHGRT